MNSMIFKTLEIIHKKEVQVCEEFQGPLNLADDYVCFQVCSMEYLFLSWFN